MTDSAKFTDNILRLGGKRQYSYRRSKASNFAQILRSERG